MTLFSVVIPLFNKEPHIQRTINSVLAQKVQDFEIIIVDDGSTDNSAEVVKNFKDQRIRLIKQKNAGVSAARNNGIKEAKADLIAFLDADDEWEPSFLETVLRLRYKYPEAGAYATAFETYYENGKKIKYSCKMIPPAPWEGLLLNYFLIASLNDMPISTSSICIPKNILLEFGGFQEGLLIFEDSDLWGKIALKYKIAFSQEIGSIYHLEAINRASRDLPAIEHPFTKTVSEMIKNNKIPVEILRDLNEYIAFLKINFAFRTMRNGDLRKAFRIFSSYKTKLLTRKMMYTFFVTIGLTTSTIFFKRFPFLGNILKK